MTTLQADQLWGCHWQGFVAHLLRDETDFTEDVYQWGEYRCGRAYHGKLLVAPERIRRCEKCVRKV